MADTLVLEAEAPGGQAGTSSKIENYLGFPTGISGQALAGRAWIQSQKFGARFAVARTEITALHGTRFLETVTWKHRDTGAVETRPVRNVLVMIGALPNTGWLDGTVPLDGRGFIRTGPAVAGEDASAFETSRPGVCAVGNVRAGSVKRIAFGVGEGSVCIQAVHRYLAERTEADDDPARLRAL